MNNKTFVLILAILVAVTMFFPDQDQTRKIEISGWAILIMVFMLLCTLFIMYHIDGEPILGKPKKKKK
jgi:predicted membrane protein